MAPTSGLYDLLVELQLLYAQRAGFDVLPITVNHLYSRLQKYDDVNDDIIIQEIKVCAQK